MVKDQNEAETRKVEAEKLKGDLDERNKIVDARREEAEADLANAEPALLAAQEAVKSIKRKHLDEMRALANPPKNVQLTISAVAVMIKESKILKNTRMACYVHSEREHVHIGCCWVRS